MEPDRPQRPLMAYTVCTVFGHTPRKRLRGEAIKQRCKRCGTMIWFGP